MLCPAYKKSRGMKALMQPVVVWRGAGTTYLLFIVTIASASSLFPPWIASVGYPWQKQTEVLVWAFRVWIWAPLLGNSLIHPMLNRSR